MTPELKAIASISDWSEVYHLAETYRQEEQWDKAAIALARAIELRRNFFWSYHHLGDVLAKQQQWERAAQAYDQGVKINSEFFWSWHNLGDVSIKLQQWEQATKAYSNAVRLDPEFFWSWHNLGNAFAKLQQWEQAIANYLQGIHLKPDHALSYQKLGNAFKQQGNLEQTIHHYRQLIQTPPPGSIFEKWQTQPQRLIDLADNLTQQHQIYAAIVICYLILELQPTNTDILSHLSQLIEKQGKLDQAIAHNQEKLDQDTASTLLTQLNTNPVSQPQIKAISGRIQIKNNGVITANQLNNLYLGVGWSSRPAKKLKAALNNSFSYITAWHLQEQNQEKPRLIGFARVVSDGVYQATLLDIVVHPDFQGRGVGKAIVKTLTKQLRAAQITDITLFASPYLADFYHQLGFVSQPNNLQWMLWSGESNPTKSRS